MKEHEHATRKNVGTEPAHDEVAKKAYWSATASFFARSTSTCTTPVSPSSAVVTWRTHAPQDMPTMFSLVV